MQRVPARWDRSVFRVDAPDLRNCPAKEHRFTGVPRRLDLNWPVEVAHGQELLPEEAVDRATPVEA